MIPNTQLTEDVERQPDGMPHRLIGFTALFSVMLAIAIVGMFAVGGTAGGICGVVVALITIPLIVSKLSSKSARERDHLHPSR